MSTKAWLVWLLILLLNPLWGQSELEWGILPGVNLSTQIEDGWKANLKLESRQLFYDDAFSYYYELTDLSLMIDRKIGIRAKVAAGGQLRWRDGRSVYRLRQQYTLVRNLASLKLAHRLASDQTFTADQNTIIRLRYRLGLLLPLSGDQLDHKEHYIKINTELLQIWQDNRYDIETRLGVHLGYHLSDHHKIEIGVDTRLDRLLDRPVRWKLLTAISWYVTI